MFFDLFFQEQKLYEFYQAVVPPERRERHRLKKLRPLDIIDLLTSCTSDAIQYEPHII